MFTTPADKLLAVKPIIDKYLQNERSGLSVFSFAGIFLWKDFFAFDIVEMDNVLCVFATNEMGCFLYWPPIGAVITPELMDKCFEKMDGLNPKKGLSRIDNVSDDLLALFSSDEFQIHRKSDEYCYEREAIAALKGNRYKSKRSSYNQFIHNYSFEYQGFESSMLIECLALYDSWHKHRRERKTDDIYRHMLEENRVVHENVFRYGAQLGMTGRVVKVDGKIRGYTFGYPINEEVFCVWSEVTDLNVRGLAAFIFSSFCQDPALQPYRLINVMDDFGMENIRVAKESFHPSRKIPSYVIKRK